MKQIFTSVLLAAVLTFGIVQSAPPKFESNYDTKVFVEGSSAWLVCSATSEDSPIQYKWFDRQNGDAIASNSKNDAFAIRETAEGSRLTFEKVAKSQEGIYRCTAENEHGLVSKLFEIKVNSGADTGNVTVEDVHVFNVTDTSVEFVIRASHAVPLFRVRYYEKLDNSSVTTTEYYDVDETNQSGDFLIDGLIPSGLYTFQFQVEGENGHKSEWSKPIEVVLLPYTPEIIIRGLSGNTLQVQWSAKWDDFSRTTVDGYMLSYGYLQVKDYDNWTEPKCMIKIQLLKSCYSRSYTITNLNKNSYYEIQLQAHTKSGYGKPAIMRVFVA